jgi:predicted RND superfamily exporter protein
MKNYIHFLNKHKNKIVIFTTILIALLSISLKDLAFEGNYRIWFDKDSKIIKNYDNFRSTFSGDDTFVVAFKDSNGIFNPKAIQTILDLTSKLELIDGVRKVDSLTNYQYISSVEDDIIVENFISSFNNLQHKKQLGLKDNLILNQLISKDGKTTMLAVKLFGSIGADENVNIFVMKKIEEILVNSNLKNGYKFYLSGVPAITASLVTISQHDAMILMPLAVVVVVALLFFLFRDLVGVLVPSVIIVFTFLTVLSIQILLGYKLNNFTVNIPSFISAIAIADSIHLFLAWVYYRSKNLPNIEAVTTALKANILPIALTSFTTAIGFASLGVSKIEPISTLGIAITTGAILAFLFTITIAPAILLMLNDSYKIKPIKFLNLLDTKGYGAFIVRNDKKIIYIFLMFIITIGFGLTKLKVDSNSIKYFAKDTVVRSGSSFIEKNLTGSMVYEIILDSKSKDGIKDPIFLNTIEVFEKEFKSKFLNVKFTSSIKDIVARLEKVLNKTDIDKIPQDKALIGQYLLLYSMSLPQGMEISDKIDTTEQFLRLTINSNIVDTSQDLEMIDWVNNWWSKNTKYSSEVQGQTAIFAYMQSSVTDTLIISISITLSIVALAMFLIFKNFKMLWIFILPNIAPIVLVAGVMGYLGINIDIGVAISVAVILGIAVDDTIHFFSKYFDSIKIRSFEETIDYIISHTGNAMILTTFILSFTFAMFGASSFIPNINFAIVTVIALNIALLLDLVLLPALLSVFYQKKVT